MRRIKNPFIESDSITICEIDDNFRPTFTIVENSFEFMAVNIAVPALISVDDKSPIGEGSARKAYKANLKGTSDYVIGKDYLEGNSKNKLLNDLYLLKMGAYFLNHFQKALEDNAAILSENGLGPCVEHIREFKFVEAFVAEANGKAMLFEERIRNEFKKFNSNDQVENSVRSMPYDAFSHFTLHFTDGEFLLCDLQGSLNLLTDPQIHSIE